MRQFQTSAIYYDSANAIIDKSHPNFEEIVQKNDILSDLLKEVMTVYNNDSLLRMAKDPTWRSEKIAQAIDKEKKEAEAAQKAQALAQARKDNSGMPPAGGFGGMGGAIHLSLFITHSTEAKVLKNFRKYGVLAKTKTTGNTPPKKPLPMKI
jgi:hypothetical protein